MLLAWAIPGRLDQSPGGMSFKNMFPSSSKGEARPEFLVT